MVKAETEKKHKTPNQIKKFAMLFFFLATYISS